MNASVSIQVRYDSDAVLAPIQTVYAVQDLQFCLVKKGDKEWETREVEVSGDNSQMVCFISGVEVGEELVMNPGAYKEMMDLPEIKRESKIELPEGAEKQIQAAREGTAKSPNRSCRRTLRRWRRSRRSRGSRGWPWRT